MKKSWFTWSTMLLASLGAGACRRDTVGVDEVARGVAPRYRFLYHGFVGRNDEERVLAAMPYERIELEEDGGGWGGGWKLTLRRDGRAALSGETPKTGEVHAFDFGRLCELCDAIGFESLARNYDWGGYDLPTWTISVWPPHSGDPIEVADTGGAGPVELWGLRAAIDGVARRIQWH